MRSEAKWGRRVINWYFELMCIVYLWMKIIPLHPSSRQNSPLCLTHFRASGAEAHPPKWQRLTRRITRSMAGLSWPPIAALLVHELSCHTMNIDEHWYAKKNETFQRNPTGQKLPQLSASLIKNKNSEKFKVPLWSTSTETTNFCTTCGMLWIKWPPCPPPAKGSEVLVVLMPLDSFRSSNSPTCPWWWSKWVGLMISPPK